MSEAKRLQNEQQFLVSECKRHIESNKLSLWGFKAEVASLSSQYKRIKKTLEEQERQYFCLSREISIYIKEMKMIEDTFQRFNFESLIETSSPYPVIQDIGIAISILIGNLTPSWNIFRKLLKDMPAFTEALRSFNPSNISNDQLKYFSQIYKKHNLALMVKDSKLPEEFLAFVNWFSSCYLYSIKDQEAKVLCSKIISTEKEASEVYLEIKEVTESISEGEGKLQKLMSCIERAEKNISDLNTCSGEEIDDIRRSCEKIENTIKKSSMPDSFLGEVNGPSILVESLFIQNTSELKFEDIADLSESKALISMEDMESSLPKETHSQPPRIFPPKIKKNSKKKRCCGL